MPTIHICVYSVSLYRRRAQGRSCPIDWQGELSAYEFFEDPMWHWLEVSHFSKLLILEGLEASSTSDPSKVKNSWDLSSTNGNHFNRYPMWKALFTWGSAESCRYMYNFSHGATIKINYVGCWKYFNKSETIYETRELSRVLGNSLRKLLICLHLSK